MQVSGEVGKSLVSVLWAAKSILRSLVSTCVCFIHDSYPSWSLLAQIVQGSCYRCLSEIRGWILHAEVRAKSHGGLVAACDSVYAGYIGSLS